MRCNQTAYTAKIHAPTLHLRAYIYNRSIRTRRDNTFANCAKSSIILAVVLLIYNRSSGICRHNSFANCAKSSVTLPVALLIYNRSGGGRQGVRCGNNSQSGIGTPHTIAFFARKIIAVVRASHIRTCKHGLCTTNRHRHNPRNKDADNAHHARPALHRNTASLPAFNFTLCAFPL